MISTMADWRAAADPEDLREYDRFGPWIDRVVDAVDVPRRFRPWWPELSQARYLLKVPRSYDRAQIRPGMDLYESMIAVFPDRVSVVRADPAEVVRRDVARDEVVATIRHTNLLIARWTLLLADGSSVEVEYNSVSEAVVAEVDRYLMASPEPAALSLTTPPALMPQEHFFRSVLIDLNNQSDLPVRPIHIEEPPPALPDRPRPPAPLVRDDGAGHRRRSAAVQPGSHRSVAVASAELRRQHHPDPVPADHLLRDP